METEGLLFWPGGGKSLLQRDCIGEGTNLELTHDSEGSSLLRS